MKAMKYKILLFLCIILITSTVVCAADNTTDNDNNKISKITVEKTVTKDISTTKQSSVKTVTKKDKNNTVKATPATSVSMQDQIGETYYGGHFAYGLESSNGGYVDEGNVDLYINNSFIASKNADNDHYFEWTYEDFGISDVELEVLNNYPAGDYPIKIRYTHDDTVIESPQATLTIYQGQASIDIEEIQVSNEGKIIVPVSVISTMNYIPITHGNIIATINDKIIENKTLSTSNSVELSIPARYQQNTVSIMYTDNGLFLNDVSEDLFLDVLIPGSGDIKTSVSVVDMQLVNLTHVEDDETVFDDIAIKVDTLVTTEDDETISTGALTAYYNNHEIATSSNASSILIPAKYNMEEITLNYTGIMDYDNSSTVFTVFVDKITTRTYMSYISASKNSIANIYPSITSNYPFLYGNINVYLDGNLVKTIIAEDSYISLANSRTTIGSTLDLTGLSEGEYTLTVEVEENNIYTESEYNTRLTINKIGTYIYANDRTIYIGDTVNLYARVYANNRETINTGQMSFTLDGELISTETVNNNSANIEYAIPTTLGMGEHTLVIVYEEDDSFNTSSKEVTLTLAKTSTTTTLRTWTVTDEKIVLNTQVRSWNKTINTGNITVYLDNNIVATGNVADNTSTIELPDTVTTDKKYNLRLVYSGTDYLNSSTYEVEEFVFSKKNTTVRVYPYLRTNGTCTLTGYVYSENYAKVNNGNIIFTINGKQVATAPVNNNKASTVCDMGEYDPGNYTIVATYSGSTLFRTSTNSSNVTKNPYYHKTYMNILNKTLKVKRGSSTDINATITSYTRNVTEDINARIILNATWGTEVYSQDVVFHNGVLNTKLTIPSNFELFTFYGQEITTYTLTISSERSKNFQETSQTGTVSIGEPTKIYQKSLWGYKAANVTFNSTLQDKSGKKVNTNTTARIDIYTANGKNLIATFNKQIINGQLNYVYKIPSNMTDSTYLVNITAKSNKDYAGSYRTVNMTLNNRKTYISAANTRGYIGNTVIFNGTVTDSITRSKVGTNAQVDILVDGQKLTTVTVTKGTFKYSFKNNFSSGVHTVTYNFKGDNLYSNCSRTLNFTSNKNSLRISTSSITAKIGDSINIKANITNTSGNLIKDTVYANIRVNGKQIASNLEVTGGKLSYSYNIPSGTASNSKITIIVQENSKYNSRNASTTLKINKDYQFITLTQSTITTTKGSKITISGNVTDKNRNLLSGTKLNIKIGGVDIANITSNNGKFNYEYTVTQAKGTYDITVKALESSSYLYNAKHMTLKVNS